VKFFLETWVSQNHEGKTILSFNDAKGNGVLGWPWQWHWDIMKTSTSRSRIEQKTLPTPHHRIFTGCMLFSAPNQERQSTEGNFFLKISTKMCLIMKTTIQTWLEVYCPCEHVPQN